MLRENDIKNVRKLFNRHHHVMTTAELLEAKLYHADIKQLLDEGFIERIRRGYYHWMVQSSNHIVKMREVPAT